MAQLLDHTADKTLFLSRILLRTSLSKVGSPVLFLGGTLNFLAARHAMALHFETPVERPVPWYLSMLLPRSKEPALRELRGVAAAVPNRPLLESVLAATP